MDIPKIGFVYMVTSPKSRIYVGSTRNIAARWDDYKKLQCKDQPKLYNSLKKHGPENHIFELLMTCDFIDMFKYEYLLGHHFNVLDKKKGLNCKLPPWGENPVWLSEDTLKRMSESRTGDKNPMFGLKGELNPNFGRKCSEESKIRMSKAQTGKVLSEETKRKIGLKSKGKKHTEETKKKMSENNANYFLGKTFLEEHKKNISKNHARFNLGKPMSEEAKIKLSKSKTGKKQSEEHRIKSANAANKPVLQYDKEGNFIREWNSITSAMKELHLKSGTGIIGVCKGKRKTAGGYKWKYK